MDIRVSVRINVPPEEAWAFLTDVTHWQEWYAAPVAEADWKAGGYVRFAEHDGILASTVPIGSFEEGKSVTISDRWADDIYSVRPDGTGCILEKCVSPKGGANFTQAGYAKETAKQQGYLEQFGTLCEAAYAARAPKSEAASERPSDLPEWMTVNATEMVKTEEKAETPKAQEAPAGPEAVKAPASPAAQAPAPQIITVRVPAQEPPKKPLSKKVWIPAVVVLLLAAIAILSIPFLKPYLEKQKKISLYNKAVTRMEKEDYDGAIAALSDLSKLGGYDNSAELTRYCEKGISYEEAKAQMKKGEYRAAYELLETMPGFKDADSYRKTCLEEINYEDGVALMAAGDYLAAEEKLSNSGSHADAANLIEECRVKGIRQKVEALMEEGKYSEAIDLLDTEAGQKVDDRAELRKECDNAATYQEADEAYQDGLYFTAYEAFRSLGDYKDSAERMKKCIQTKPVTRETYHNSAYNGNSSLKIIPPKDDGSYTYFKIYIKKGNEEILVSSCFISTGGTITVRMPAGKYILKVAYGYGDWFGEKEMFGSKGTYQRLQSSDTSDIFEIGNGDYELTLRSSSNGNVGTKDEDRSGF
ncbi:MAG: SRPBCC family protein [Lachnospiraceae bacterium]|nr:SRPBCC family protein [Lachnospiraceae bacterium]